MLFSDVLLFLLLCRSDFGLGAKSTANIKKTWGPYTSTLLGMKQCEDTTNPLSKGTFVYLNMEIKNNFMKGNLTALKDGHDVKITLEDYYYENGKLERTFLLRELSCRNSLVAAIMKQFGVTYVKRTCLVPKGKYFFEADFNKMEHMWMTSRRYGKMLRRVTLFCEKTTALCYNVQVEVQPKKEE